MYCGKCGTQIDEGGKACTSCGTDISKYLLMYCDKCGTQIDNRGKFCMNCGTDISRYWAKSLSLGSAKTPVDKLELKEVKQKVDGSVARVSISKPQSIKVETPKSSKSSRNFWVLIAVSIGAWLLWGERQRTPEPVREDMVSVTDDLKYSDYPVNGFTTEDIFASIERNADDCDLEEGHAVGCFEYETSDKSGYYYERTSDNSCLLNSIDIHLELEIKLPKHIGSGLLTNSLSKKWYRLVEEVTDHEETHLDITRDMMDELPLAFTEIYDQYETCDELRDELDNVVDRWWARLENRHEKFDEGEIKACEKKSQPYEDRLNANKIDRERLVKVINGMESQLGEFNINNDSSSYYELLPRYERKLDEYNRLVEEVPGLVEIHAWLCHE